MNGHLKRVWQRLSIAIHNQPTSRTGRFIWQVIALAAIGFIVRLVYVWQIRESPFFDVLMGDARRYDAWAMEIAAGD